MIDVTPIPILNDNYVWALISKDEQKAVIIDPGEAAPVLRFLRAHKLTLAAILITHRHWDHTNGINDVLAQHPCAVYGPYSAAIPQVNHTLHEGDSLSLFTPDDIQVIEIPGHTEEHIGYLFQNRLFCGDTLFSAGCGRLLGGTATQLKHSLDRIKAMPEQTLIHCTHEYTLANLRFAQAIMPTNPHLKGYQAFAVQKRDDNQPTLPSTIEREKQINPFLRCNDSSVIEAVSQKFQLASPSELDIFCYLRQWKDSF